MMVRNVKDVMPYDKGGRGRGDGGGGEWVKMSGSEINFRILCRHELT